MYLSISKIHIARHSEYKEGVQVSCFRQMISRKLAETFYFFPRRKWDNKVFRAIVVNKLKETTSSPLCPQYKQRKH